MLGLPFPSSFVTDTSRPRLLVCQTLRQISSPVRDRDTACFISAQRLTAHSAWSIDRRRKFGVFICPWVRGCGLST